MKKLIKRALSWLLISGMVLAEPMQVLADNMPEEKEISGQQLEDVPEDGNYVYLGTSSVNISEGDGVFSLPIYRTGDIDKKASVTIRAISLTAEYNKDYTLVGSKKSVGLTSANIMQLVADPSLAGNASVDTDSTIRHYEGTIDVASPSELNDQSQYTLTDLTQTDSYTLDNKEIADGIELYNKLKSKATPSEAVEAELISTAESDNDNSDSEDEDSDKSPLARIKEQQTGQPTRETADTEYVDADLTDQILGAIMPEYIQELPYACEQVISFDKDEDTAWLKFRIYDNSESDGNRMFSLYIVDTKNVESYKVTSTSVTIEDDEDAVNPTISFDKDSYDASGNVAEIIVKRDGLANAMATADLYAYDLSTNEETALGQVAFLPYETEKVVKLNVDHEVALELTNLKAADEGETTTAHITGAERDLSKGGLSVLSVAEDNEESEDESDIMLLSDDGDDESSDSSNTLSFDISINSKSYEVQYEKAKKTDGKIVSGPVKGKIYDNTYSPALEVGEYYFSTSEAYGGMYDYSLRRTGDKPWGGGTLEESYTPQNDSNGAWDSAHGNLKYYHTIMWRKGTVYNAISNGKSIVTAPLYQFIIPNMASTSSFGGGQKTDFVFKGDGGKDVNGRRHSGWFNKSLQDDLALRIKKGKGTSELNNYDYIYPFAKAVDDDWHTPKSYVEYYGFAALYKMYNVTINNPQSMQFRSYDTTIDAVPVQTEVACGADQLYEKQAKMVYVNEDEDKSNLVFKLKKNTVNGQDDVFCELKGYTIKLGNGKNTCTVRYPEDFISFLNNSSRTTTDLMDYSVDGKNKELKKLEDIATVSLDKYFIDWIDTVQSDNGIDVINDIKCLSSQGYYQNLVFTPIVEYIDTKVKVTAPVLDGGKPVTNSGVSFKNKELKEGSELVYHAGDRLDLSIESKSSRYTVMGYEVSTDGGHSFNTIRNKNELVLLPGNVRGYIIRPCIQENDNCIELTYSRNSLDKVHVDNVIPQSAFEDYPELQGRYFLDINPEAKDPYERMRPEPGKCYSIDILVDDSTASSSDNITRPTVTDILLDKTYNTNKHYLIAKKNKSDNRYMIGTEEMPKERIIDFTLNGQILMKAGTIRSSALGYRNIPMVGYTAFTGGPQAAIKDSKTGKLISYVSTVSGVVPSTAGLSLTGVKGAVGDRITVAIDNGINDTQVNEVILGELSNGAYNLGQLVVTYPITAPYFVSVDYEYDDPLNSQKVDHRDNTVNCFDDTFTLTAAINPNGRQIDKVVFLVYTASGGLAATYEAAPKVNDDGSISNSVFEAKIDKMLEKFRNGDRIYAYIVDKEVKQVGSDIKLPVVYPTMDTGLIMCVQNELIKPKSFEAGYEPEYNQDLPIIGKPALSGKSGAVTFTKTKSADNMMYVLTVNADAYLSNMGTLTQSQKLDVFKDYTESIKRVNAGRQMAAAAAMPGDTAAQVAARDAAMETARQYAQGLPEDQFDRDHPMDGTLANRRQIQAADRKASLTKNAIISGDAWITLTFTFVYDAKRDTYLMASAAGTLGGMVSVNKTIYWIVGSVPVYLNLTGAIQAGLSFTGFPEEMEDAIRDGDFNNYTGNITELKDKLFQIGIEGIFMGKFSVGAGVYGCLGARVYGAATLDIDYLRTWAKENEVPHTYGFLISCAVGLGFDLLATSIEFDLVKAQLGLGEFENQTEVSYLGGIIDNSTKPKLSSQSEADETLAAYDDEAEYLTLDESEAESYDDESGYEYAARIRSVGLGTDDFQSFASYDDSDDADTMLRSIPTLKNSKILLNPAAEHTRSRLIQLGDKKQLIVFLGRSRENANESTLYYTVGFGDKWSEPEAVYDDGTFDTTPDVLKVDDDRVLIVWADARTSLSDVAAKSDDFTDKYKLFNISAAFFNFNEGENGKMGEAFTLQDDTVSYSNDEDARFFNVYPKLSMQGDKIYCTYLKRDVSKAYDGGNGNELKLLDFNSLYSSMAYVTCDLDGENVSKEQLIYISTAYDEDGKAIQDPLVTDYKVQTFTLKELKNTATGSQLNSKKEEDVDYIAAIYTIDTDGDIKTSEDRNIYLAVYDVTHKKRYYPIMISSSKESYVNSSGKIQKRTNEVSQTSPELSKFGGRLYATWVEDGHNFVLVDLSNTLQTLLGTNGISEFYTGGNTTKRTDSVEADNASGTGKASAEAKVDKQTPTNLSRDSKPKATPTELKDEAKSNNQKLSINSISLSAETTSLLKVLRNSLNGGSAEFSASTSPRTWRKLLGANGTDTGWLGNGNNWHETEYEDISEMLKNYYTNLYQEEFADIDSNNFNAEEKKEIKKEKEELLSNIIKDINETDEFTKDSYNSLAFGKLSNDDIQRSVIDITQYSGSTGMGEYKLAYDGTDIYVLYTSACGNPTHIGTELYGMRLKQPSGDNTKDSGNTDTLDESGFTKPAMITYDDNPDDYLDEFDVCMDSGKNMYAVANLFKVGKDSKGNPVNEASNNNTLMYYYFEPGGSIRVDSGSEYFSSSFVKGQDATVSFDIENSGLFDTEQGYDVSIDIVDADKETVIKENVYSVTDSEAIIKAGEKQFISANWQVPDRDLTGCYLRITTGEGGYTQQSVTYVAIPVKAKVKFTEKDISFDGEKLNVTATIANIGNADSKAVTVRLFDHRNTSDKELQQQYIGVLKSGESKNIEFSFKPTIDIFDSLGYINLMVAAMCENEDDEDDDVLDSVYPSFMPNRPVFCVVNDGVDKLTLNQGDTKQLTIDLIPWNSAIDNPSFSSSDPTVGYVDESGVLHALKGGKCTITVYYPQLGVSTDIELTVKGSDNTDNRSYTGARNRGSEALASYGSPVRGAVRGTWTLQANGKWAFTANGRSYASEWAYIYNPYATGTQEQYNWFRFDAEGNMVTGWYKDADGKWYYLWELSDNMLGHMVTGWHYIGGKWYYFSTVNGGPLGYMLYSTRTPDGYYVGADGAWTGQSYAILMNNQN